MDSENKSKLKSGICIVYPSNKIRAVSRRPMVLMDSHLKNLVQNLERGLNVHQKVFLKQNKLNENE